MAEQELFWISTKTCWGAGKKLVKYGDKINGKIPAEDFPALKKSGEIGTIEVASPEGVKVDRAYEKAFDDLKASEEKVLDLQMAIEKVVELLGQSTIKKEEKESMIKELEGLK